MNKNFRFTSLFSFFIYICFVCHGGHAQQSETYLVVNNPHHSGFFATFGSILGALDFYENNSYAGIKVELDTYFLIDPEQGPNWWEYYFKPIRLGDETKKHYTFKFEDISHFITSGFTMSRIRAHHYIRKYIHVRPEIVTEMNRYINKNFRNCFVIGVHYRGTDKIAEAPRVSYERAERVVTSIISQFNSQNYKIYVASDEAAFVDYLKQCYPSKVIHSDFVRSTNDAPIHYNTTIYQNNYQKGKEALLDCLILSRCNYLIRTESCLSAISACFNPNLPVSMLKPE